MGRGEADGRAYACCQRSTSGTARRFAFWTGSTSWRCHSSFELRFEHADPPASPQHGRCCRQHRARQLVDDGRAAIFRSTGQAPSICGERPRDDMGRQPARPVLRVTSSEVVSVVGRREAVTVRWRDHRRVKEPGRVELGCRSFAEGDHEESDDEDHGAACCDRGGKSQGEALTP